MQLPDSIPAHQLLTPDVARIIFARLFEVAEAAIGPTLESDMPEIIASASEQIQQTMVDFVQAEIERAAKNGRPFRLVARRA